MLVYLEEHVLDAVEAGLGDCRKRSGDVASCANIGLEKVFHEGKRNAGCSFQEKGLEPLEEVLLVVWHWRVRHKGIPDRV